MHNPPRNCIENNPLRIQNRNQASPVIPLRVRGREGPHPQYGRQEEEARRIFGAKPDYKKAYVTLRKPLSISPDLYPLRVVEEERERMNKQRRSSSVVEDEEGKEKHWLDGRREQVGKNGFLDGKREQVGKGGRGGRGGGGGGGAVEKAKAKFPWSSMRTGR